MKAVVYNKSRTPDKLVYCDVDKPVPDDNEVLIKVNAVSFFFVGETQRTKFGTQRKVS
jgi:NADPH:quinone reductase-like Zn-dependent oxidoreductase